MSKDLTDAYLQIEVMPGGKILLRGETDDDQGELGILFSPQMAFEIGHKLIAAAKQATPREFRKLN
jgi:hypothetical protein